ncbi:MAG: putative mitochondrial protein, conserved [Candelina submexicana]|nr:MAG: putative mitochondrial protein, conserved [Candelina submexicana]
MSRLFFCALPLRRTLTTTTRLYASPSWSTSPAPPRLPKEEQEIFERLQSSSTGAFSTPKPNIVVTQSPQAASSTSSAPVASSSSNTNQAPAHTPSEPSDHDLLAINARVEATGDGEELHPDIRRGARPEFEGETNPSTGEIGGPKNEPLRWGGDVDWSYNGRVTDF